MGRKRDDLPEIELVDEAKGERTTAEVVVAPGSRPWRVWLVVGAVVLGVGAVASNLWGNGELEEAGPTSTTASTTSTTMAERADAADAPAPDDIPVSADVLATYDLMMLGAVLREDTTSEPTGGLVTVWASADTQLSLSVRPGVEGPGPCAPTTPVESPSESQRTVWVSVPPSEPTALLCWNRPSGAFWMLQAHWSHDTPSVADREERLRSWAQAISTDGPTGTSDELQDQQMRRVASDPGGPTRARARVWDYDGQEIVLFVIENSSAASLRNLLATGRTDRIAIQGLGDVWTTDTSAGWAVPGDSELWATLSVPPELATELDRILEQLDGPITAPVR